MHKSQTAVAKLKGKFVPPTLSGRQTSNTSLRQQQHSRSTTPCIPTPDVKSNLIGNARDSGVGLDSDEDAEDDNVVVVEDDRIVWQVQYRIPQQKKNKTWEDDGWIIIKGETAVLRNETGKEIARGSFNTVLVGQEEFKIGGKDCILDRASTFDEFQSNCGTTGSPASLAQPAQASRMPTHSINKPSMRQASAIPAHKLVPTPSTIDRSNQRPLSKLKRPLEIEIINKEEEQENSPPQSKKEKILHHVKEDPARRKSIEFIDTPVRKMSTTDKGTQATPDMMLNGLVDEDGVDSMIAAKSKGKSLFRSPASAQQRPDDEEEPASSPAERHSSLDLAIVPKTLDFEEDDVEMEELLPSESSVEIIRANSMPSNSLARQIVAPSNPRPITTGFKPIGAKKVIQDKNESVSIYYSCMWRNRTTKKNVSWDGDGILVVTGRECVLKDQTNGRDLASAKTTSTKFEQGDSVQVGSKVVEIDSVLDPQSYLDGSVFTNSFKAPPVASTSFKLPAISVPSKFKNPIFGGRVSVSSTSFYGSADKGKQKEVVARFNPNAEGAVVMLRPDAAHNSRFNPKGLPVVDVVLDPALSHKLRPHQIEGVKFMYECAMGMRTECQGCILADDMGLGKTAQAITLIWTLLRQNAYHGNSTAISRAMVVCPVTLIKNWSAEFKKWLGRDKVAVFTLDANQSISSFVASKTYQVLIIGYEKLRTVITELKSAQPPIGLIICDEGHRLKSAKTKVSQTLKLLSTPRRIILSGTPIQNDLSEFHAMVDFVNPGCFDTYPIFKRVFESVIVKSREPKANRATRELGTKRSEQLARISEKFVIRRTADVMAKFLPPKLEYVVFVIPTKLQIDMYQAILRGHAVADLLSGQGGQQLVLMSVLQKLCNSPGLLYKSAKAKKSLEIITSAVLALLPPGFNPNDFALSGKLLAFGALLETLHKSNEEKIIVVSNFTSTLDIVEAHCKAKRYPYCRLDGETKGADRIPMVNAFNSGPLSKNFIFLVSSKSGGTGLNLIGASRLVLLDSDWNPSVDQQAMARIHRDGQKRQCVIYRFLTTGTLDEKIYQRQITKIGLSTSLMDNGKNANTEAAKANAFTRSELRTVFQLHTGIACQTHELLACQCHLDDYDPIAAQAEQDALDAVPDDASSPEKGGFCTASQFGIDSSPDVSNKDRKNLSLLREWNHHSTGTEDETEQIEDEVLKTITYAMITSVLDEEGGFREDCDEGILAVDGTRGMSGLSYRGGFISFAFAKKSSAAASIIEEE